MFSIAKGLGEVDEEVHVYSIGQYVESVFTLKDCGQAEVCHVESS